MSPANQVWLSEEAFANIDEMRPDARREARGLIVTLAASPLSRLPRRIDIGVATREGFKIWAYQDDEFWLYYTEGADGSLTIVSIWQR